MEKESQVAEPSEVASAAASERASAKPAARSKRSQMADWYCVFSGGSCSRGARIWRRGFVHPLR